MENNQIFSTYIYHVPVFETNKQLVFRNEVIDYLSRAPVKVRHWLLTNEKFQAGLETLNPSSNAWVPDEKVRALIKTGLIHMVESAVDFVCAFPDAQIPLV
jgi:hypothetical protein